MTRPRAIAAVVVSMVLIATAALAPLGAGTSQCPTSASEVDTAIAVDVCATPGAVTVTVKQGDTTRQKRATPAAAAKATLRAGATVARTVGSAALTVFAALLRAAVRSLVPTS